MPRRSASGAPAPPTGRRSSAWWAAGPACQPDKSATGAPYHTCVARDCSLVFASLFWLLLGNLAQLVVRCLLSVMWPSGPVCPMRAVHPRHVAPILCGRRLILTADTAISPPLAADGDHPDEEQRPDDEDAHHDQDDDADGVGVGDDVDHQQQPEQRQQRGVRGEWRGAGAVRTITARKHHTLLNG